MDFRANNPQRCRRIIKRIAIFLGISAALLGTAAFVFSRIFFRQAEAAVRLLPHDTQFLVTIDVQPSMGQIWAFRSIEAAMERHGLTKQADDALLEAFKDSPYARGLRPLVRRSVAIALIDNGERHMAQEPVFLVGLSDSDAAGKILGKGVGKESPVEFSQNGRLMAAVVEDMLVVSASATAIERIRAVSSGKERSLRENAEYIEARASLDSDANVMMFVSSDRVDELFTELRSPGHAAPDAGWLAFGLALRDDGVSLSMQMPMSENYYKPYRHLAEMEPLSPKLLDKIPPNPYCVFAVSQPAAMWEMAHEAIVDSSDGYRIVDDIARGLDEATGLNIGDDIASAGNGSWIYAAYPMDRATSTPEGGSTIFVMDDSNGAAPARLVNRVTGRIEDFISRGGGRSYGTLFRRVEDEGLELYTLNGDLQREFQRDVDRSAPPKVARLFRDKTIAYGFVGESVLVSDDPSLIKETARTLGGGALSLETNRKVFGQSNTDAVFSPTRASLNEGAQVLAVVDIRRCAEAVEASMDWSQIDSRSEPLARKVFASLKELRAPLTISTRFDEDSVSSKVFIPLDYDRLAELYATEGVRPIARLRDTSSRDLSNAKQITLGLLMYCGDYDDVLPPSSDSYQVEEMIQPYVKNREIFLTADGGRFQFSEFMAAMSLSSVEEPAETPLVFAPAPDNQNMRVVAYADGHAKRISESAWVDLRSRFSHLVSPLSYRTTVVVPDEPTIKVEESPTAPPLLNASDRLLAASDLAGKTAWELTVLRNEPYARKGYIFKREDLQQHFRSQSWYSPQTSDMAAVASRLTAIEKNNTEFIQTYQKENGLVD